MRYGQDQEPIMAEVVPPEEPKKQTLNDALGRLLNLAIDDPMRFLGVVATIIGAVAGLITIANFLTQPKKGEEKT